MFFTALIKMIVAIVACLIPLGQLPAAAPDYCSIANPAAIVMEVRTSDPKGKQFRADTQNAVGLFVHTVIDSMTDAAIDRTILRTAMNACPIRPRAESAQGRQGGGTMPENAGGFFQMLLKGNRDLFIYLIPTDHSGVYEIAGDYAMYDGTQMQAVSGIYYDSQSGLIYTENQKGIYGTSYNFEVGTFLVSMENNAFQRNFGFCALYDTLAPVLGMYIRNVRIKFPYDGKDWMIEAWKGNYSGLANGAEVGIYEKPQSRKIEFYDCSALELPMGITLYNGQEKLFDQALRRTWWAGAFLPGPRLRAANLRMEATIVFEDAGMQDAFVQALSATKGVAFTQDGAAVEFIW